MKNKFNGYSGLLSKRLTSVVVSSVMAVSSVSFSTSMLMMGATLGAPTIVQADTAGQTASNPNQGVIIGKGGQEVDITGTNPPSEAKFGTLGPYRGDVEAKPAQLQQKREGLKAGDGDATLNRKKHKQPPKIKKLKVEKPKI